MARRRRARPVAAAAGGLRRGSRDVTMVEHARPPSSRCDEPAAGWYGPSGPPPDGPWVRRLGERQDPKWDTFSWVSLRVLLEAVNHSDRRARACDRSEIGAPRYAAAQRGGLGNAGRLLLSLTYD